MWMRLVLGFVVLALILLIMRISYINDKLRNVDEQLSDLVTHAYLHNYLDLSVHTPSQASFDAAVKLMTPSPKHELRTHDE